MAASHSSPPGLPADSSSAGGRSTLPPPPKLRDSCHACASSKLKCYKEKPTCSRCAKRGITCEYVATKRGGRKPNNRSSISENRGNNASNTTTTSANNKSQLPQLSNWFAPYSAVSSADPSPSPGVVYPSPRPTTSGSSDMFPNLFSPVDQTLSSVTTDPNTDLNDFFTSPISFSMPEMSDISVLGQADFFSTGVDSSGNNSEAFFDNFPIFEPTASEQLAFSSPSSSLNNCTSPARELQNYQEIRASDSPCSCLVQALGLMKQLFPQSSNACMTLATQSPDKATIIPTIQTVIAKNEATIEAVSTMLKCSCSQDGYLLTIMSLIVFKVLGWYAAAARKTPYSGDSNGSQSPQAFNSYQSSQSEQVLQDSTVVDSYCLDGEDSARMAAQLILSKLHHVRRLVNQLSSKLKVQAAKNGGRADTPSCSDHCGNADSEMTLALSTVMSDQLDVDLRKRLRALSSEILEGLRRL